MKALLLENIHAEAGEILAKQGYEVEILTGALGEDELISALVGVDLLGIRSKTKITDRVLASETNKLSAVGAFCIGTNQIDLKAAAKRGVAVFNAPYFNTRSVVELAIAEIICLARKLTDKNTKMHQGIWDKSATGSHEIRGRTLGIVGYGNIGSQLSVLAESMGMRVLFYDIADKMALGNAKRVASLEDLLAEAEVISLHIDGRPENIGFFGKEQFNMMRPRSLFLNLCRGTVVDIESLTAHLQSGRIAGAALDVFPQEPKVAGDPFSNGLQGMDNVILTPHIGGSTQEAQFEIGRFVANKLAEYVNTGATQMSVNMPQLQAISLSGPRITYLHRNIPGVMAKLNSLLAKHGMNIGYQVLATKGELGYSITDTSGGDIAGLVPEISSVPETIAIRLLEV